MEIVLRERCHPISNPIVVDMKKKVRVGLGLNARRIKQDVYKRQGKVLNNAIKVLN